MRYSPEHQTFAYRIYLYMSNPLSHTWTLKVSEVRERCGEYIKLQNFGTQKDFFDMLKNRAKERKLNRDIEKDLYHLQQTLGPIETFVNRICKTFEGRGDLRPETLLSLVWEVSFAVIQASKVLSLVTIIDELLGRLLPPLSTPQSR